MVIRVEIALVKDGEKEGFGLSAFIFLCSHAFNIISTTQDSSP
jgi:hypothetical protein